MEEVIMKHYTYYPKGVCCSQIDYDLDEENRLHDIRFTRGCNGNLKMISKLLEGLDARGAADKMKGNDCAGKGTSCADQFSRALYEALGVK